MDLKHCFPFCATKSVSHDRISGMAEAWSRNGLRVIWNRRLERPLPNTHIITYTWFDRARHVWWCSKSALKPFSIWTVSDTPISLNNNCTHGFMQIILRWSYCPQGGEICTKVVLKLSVVVGLHTHCPCHCALQLLFCHSRLRFSAKKSLRSC